MAFYQIFRESDSPIELKIEFNNMKEALLLYYELFEARVEWSASARDFFLALRTAGERPRLH